MIVAWRKARRGRSASAARKKRKETQHGEGERRRRIGGGGEACGVEQRGRRGCGGGEEGRAEGERGNLGERATDFLLILLDSDGSLGLGSSEGGVGDMDSFFVRGEGMVEGSEREEGGGAGRGCGGEEDRGGGSAGRERRGQSQ